MSENLSEKISIIIQAIDDTKGAVNKAVKDMTGLGEASKRASTGVNQAEKSLKGTVTATKEMWQACERASKAVDKTGKSLGDAARNADKASKEFDKTKKGATGLADAMSGVVQVVGALTTAFTTLGLPIIEAATFERKMKEVAAVSKATEAEFDALTIRAREMGRVTEFSAQQSAEGLKLLAMGGLNATQAIKALPAALNLALVGGIALGDSADYVTNIMGGMRLGVEDLEHVVDVLAETTSTTNSNITELAEAMSYAAPAAAAAGMSIDETAAAMGILHDNGIKASRAGTNLRGILSTLAKPTKEGADALAAMGVEIAKNANGSIDFHETFRRLGEAQMDLGQATAIFNKLNAGAALIFANSTEKLTRVTEENTNAQGRAAKMAADYNNSTVGAYRNFKSAAADVAIELGNKFLPAVTAVLKSLTTFANVVGSLVETFPNAARAIGVAVTALTAFVAVSGSAKVVMYGMELAFAGMGTKIATATGLVVKLGLALKALAVSNPILAAITVAVTAGATAWAIFGESSFEASEKHAEAALAIDKARESAEKEVATLNDLRNTLLTAKQGSTEHANAQQRLAEVVPGVNLSLDEQGRVLGTVTGELDNNIAKLDEYITLKQKEAEMNTAFQLQEMALAYSEASTSVADYKNNLETWYGIGKEQQNIFQSSVIWLNKLTGTYQNNIKEGANMRENLEKQKSAFEAFLAKLASSGTTFEQVDKMLNDIHLDESTKANILEQYSAMLAGMTRKASEEAGKAKQAQTDAMSETTKITGEQLTSMKQQWEGYAERVRTLTDEIVGATRSLNDELRGMAQSGMSDLEAWKDRKAQAKEYYAAAQEAIAEANAAKAAGNEALYTQKMEEAKQLAIESKDAYKSLNEEVKSNGQVVISSQEGLKIAMDGVKEAGALVLEVMKDQRQTAADSMADLEKKVDFSTLTEGIDAVKLKWIEGWKTMADSANEQIADIDMKLDAVAKKERWATIWVKEGKAETVTGTYQNGGVAGYATGGFPRRSGSLPGWGGGDKIRALLEAGEFIVRKEAVRKYGVDLLYALNGMRLNLGSTIKAQVGGLIPSVPRIPNVQPVRMASGGAVAGASRPAQVVELRFSGGSLYGDRGSVDGLLRQLEEAGMSA